MPKTKYPILKCLHRGEKGFTLIELLIVVAILAIIAAVVIPNISKFMLTGRLAAANSEAEEVKTAALGFFGEYGYWPTSSDNLTNVGYISGTLKATYSIDPNCGWLYAATPIAPPNGWPSTISFQGGATCVNGTGGQHGTWKKA
jgi:type IV pilus assembly protein PilA